MVRAREITLDDIRARVRARFERVLEHLHHELDGQARELAYPHDPVASISIPSGVLHSVSSPPLPEERRLAYIAAVWKWRGIPGFTIGKAFDLLAAKGDELVNKTACHIYHHAHAELVPVDLRQAVLSREELVTRWPWPREAPENDPPPWTRPESHAPPFVPGVYLSVLEALSPTLPPGELLPGSWPREVAQEDLAKWIDMEGAETTRVGQLLGISSLWGASAVIFAVLLAVEKDRRRPAMAIDAGKPHQDLLVGWRDLPKNMRDEEDLPEPHGGRIELLEPGRCVQLSLPECTLSEATLVGLRTLRSWRGLRNWAALQRLFSVEGGRRGWVRWTLDDHLEALGYSPKERTRSTVRTRLAREVEALTRLELAAYDRRGKLRERRPLLIVGSKFDRLEGSEWELDGMELQINPLLYQGVRKDGGELGSNWHPAPVELPRIDPARHRYAYSLGLILPIRWRLALAEDRDHLHYTGKSLLRLAGIPFSRHDPGKAWRALERDLEKLREIGLVGRWDWTGTPRTLAGMMDLYPAEWMVDRTLWGVRPVEIPPGPAVLSGAELKVWRKDRGLTQTRAAEALGVVARTIIRAEKDPGASLSSQLADRLRSLR